MAWSDTLGLFLVVDLNGDTIYSSDGTTWTDGGNVTVTYGIQRLVWWPGGQMFVTCGYTGTNKSSYSRDGKTWSALATTDDSVNWVAVAASDSAVVIGQLVSESTGNFAIIEGNDPWYDAVDEANAISLGDLGPGDSFPLWFKRIVDAGAASSANETFTLSVKGTPG